MQHCIINKLERNESFREAFKYFDCSCTAPTYLVSFVYEYRNLYVLRYKGTPL